MDGALTVTRTDPTRSALLADFDRTLVRLFDDQTLNRMAATLQQLYARAGVHQHAITAHSDPYAIWSAAYTWMANNYSRIECERIHHAASCELARWECDAAVRAKTLPGVRQTLEWLRKRAVRCAIVSANAQEAIELALEHNSLAGFFDHVRGRWNGEPPETLKPNPLPLQDCLHILECSPEKAAYIGDSRGDAQAARAAGIVAIGVLTGQCTASELSTAGADRVIADFGAIKPIWIELERHWSREIVQSW
jgi:phosphoglycolate phosphatase-like HAD superfamily hydrolase